MARQLRIHYPGAIHGLMNRGDRQAAIFLDQKDRGEACDKTHWHAHKRSFRVRRPR